MAQTADGDPTPPVNRLERRKQRTRSALIAAAQTFIAAGKLNAPVLEITQAAISVWGADRVGVRIAPSGTYGSMSDSDPAATFGHVATEFDRLGVAYLHVVEPRIKGIEEIVGSDRSPASSAKIPPHPDCSRRFHR